VAATVVTQFASASDSVTHNIPLSGRTDDGTLDLFAVIVAGAAFSAPAPWLDVDQQLDDNYCRFIRLPKASNVAGLTQLQISLSASRALAAVVWEDEWDEDAGNFFINVHAQGIVSGNLLGTGLTTFVQRDEALAVFAVSNGPSDVGVSSFDQGYTAWADSGYAVTTSPQRIFVARETNTSFNNDGVTATLSGTPAEVDQAYTFIVAYNSGTPTPPEEDGPYETAVKDDNPIHYWRMGAASGSDVDEIGAVHLNIGAGVTREVAGALTAGAGEDGAMQFPGTSSGWAQTSAAIPELAGAPIATIELWVNWDSPYALDDDFLFEYGPNWATNDGSFVCDMHNSTGGESGTISIGFRQNGVQRRVTIPQSAIPAGEWHHLVVVFDGSSGQVANQQIKVYVDGSPVTVTVRQNGTNTTAGTFDADTLDLMSRDAGSALRGAGKIDEVALYDYALSQAQAQAHFDAASSEGGGGAPPANTTPPALTGVPLVGETLSCTTGSWTNSPTSYAYQWKRGGVAISGETTDSYTLVLADEGETILCTVTATNAEGSDSEDSNSLTLSKLTIAQENALAGVSNLSEITIAGAGDPLNQGFCREFSLNVGETAHFACHGDGSVLDIYRIGWYGGQHWRKVASIANTPTTQPAPATISNSNGAVTCEAWDDTASWQIPTLATPGLYVGVLRNAAQNNGSWIPFVVRDDDRPADIMVKMSDATWALAYNYFGDMSDSTSPFEGKSVYGSGGAIGGTGGITDRCFATTYLKPIVTRQGVENTWFHYEIALIGYLERMGFDVNYSSCKDWMETTPPTLAEADIYISCGHDEYWDQNMRDRWEALRDDGKHLLFMSANEVFWRTRWDDSLQGFWCYKDTMDGPSTHNGGEPLDPVSWTGTWRDTRWAQNEPENELTGTLFRMNSIPSGKNMVIAASDPIADHVFWRHTDVTTAGLTINGMIGGEADEMVPTQPAESQAVLAATTVNIDGSRADDNGEDYGGNGDMDWGLIAQRYASGAVVVGFGTWRWSWGLDGYHDLNYVPDEISQVQQATLNLLRDLGASAPATPIAGLTLPTPASLDNYGEIPGAVVQQANMHRQVSGAWVQYDFTP
jgi:hypothetical protein